jgi:hypothetical protein
MSSCERCNELERQLETVTRELAAERERANALFVAYPPQVAPLPATPPGPPDQAVSAGGLLERVPGYALLRRTAQKLVNR